jgi:putative restriction endonuclease
MSLFITFNSVNIQELIQKITDITIWKKGDQRAPHKPLLLLNVLSQYRQGHERLFNCNYPLK